MSAEKIIQDLKLISHPEGGYYKRTYQSTLKTQAAHGIRPTGTAIYYLLESKDFSCWHRHKADEIWHHYHGSNLILYQINAQGELTQTLVGSIFANTVPQCLIPANTWFAAEVETPNSFAFIGCSLAPGFDFEDFEIAEQTKFIASYPQHTSIIKKLSRPQC